MGASLLIRNLLQDQVAPEKDHQDESLQSDDNIAGMLCCCKC